MTRTLGSMRKLRTPNAPSSLLSGRSFVLNTHRQLFEHEPTLSLQALLPSRSLAQVRQEPFSDLWFTPSRPARSPADDLLGNNGRPGNGDHRPPDERTLKLGKSLLYLSFLQRLPLTMCSPPHPLSSPTKHSHPTSSTEHPLPKHIPPPLPFNTSTPSSREGQSSLPRRSMDSSSSMGLRTASRQRQTPNPLRKDRSHRVHISTTVR